MYFSRHLGHTVETPVARVMAAAAAATSDASVEACAEVTEIVADRTVLSPRHRAERWLLDHTPYESTWAFKVETDKFSGDTIVFGRSEHTADLRGLEMMLPGVYATHGYPPQPIHIQCCRSSSDEVWVDTPDFKGAEPAADVKAPSSTPETLVHRRVKRPATPMIPDAAAAVKSKHANVHEPIVQPPAPRPPQLRRPPLLDDIDDPCYCVKYFTLRIGSAALLIYLILWIAGPQPSRGRPLVMSPPVVESLATTQSDFEAMCETARQKEGACGVTRQLAGGMLFCLFDLRGSDGGMAVFNYAAVGYAGPVSVTTESDDPCPTVKQQRNRFNEVELLFNAQRRFVIHNATAVCFQHLIEVAYSGWSCPPPPPSHP